jgi:GDP-mannose transporter
MLVLGCVVGTGIGYTGWWCRSKVSAATYTLIGVMNKCLTVMVNLLIWDQHAPPAGIVCLSLCLFGGMLYNQAPMKKTKSETPKHEGGDSDKQFESLIKDGGRYP